jgi:hypothetical protein
VTKRRFPIATNGDRITPIMSGYKMSCCDCGLVHRLDFEVVEQFRNNPDGTWTGRKPRNKNPLRVVLIPARDNRSTGQHRRQCKARGESLNER